MNSPSVEKVENFSAWMARGGMSNASCYERLDVADFGKIGRCRCMLRPGAVAKGAAALLIGAAKRETKNHGFEQSDRR